MVPSLHQPCPRQQVGSLKRPPHPPEVAAHFHHHQRIGLLHAPANSSSGSVPIKTVNTSSPQAIGWAQADQQPTMPGNPGTTSTGTRPRRRNLSYKCMNEP